MIKKKKKSVCFTTENGSKIYPEKKEVSFDTDINTFHVQLKQLRVTNKEARKWDFGNILYSMPLKLIDGWKKV